ncbi:MAG TPA: TauD/TfdA family dioxygenase [Gammaproteobacteria bacterium]|jgi:alpha-ketoglutarate-dependent taurine dioxygenase
MDTDSPFLPANESAYRQWRKKKLMLREENNLQMIEIKNPDSLSPDEYGKLSSQIAVFNLALFRLAGNPGISNETLKSLGSRTGLRRLDGNLYANDSDISELRVIDKGRRGEYIPYTNRPLGWHTDGYYNSPEKTIRTFILYCVSDAESGGENQLLDPELAYIHLRDHDTALIEAMMHPAAFTIPKTVEAGGYVRPAESNPVFQIDPENGALLMRYTQRKTHIQWREDDMTRQALSLLGDLLSSDSDHILNMRLKPGEGLICNNVLHNRSGFSDSQAHSRIMLRARYYDRFKEYTHA